MVSGRNEDNAANGERGHRAINCDQGNDSLRGKVEDWPLSRIFKAVGEARSSTSAKLIVTERLTLV